MRVIPSLSLKVNVIGRECSSSLLFLSVETFGSLLRIFIPSLHSDVDYFLRLNVNVCHLNCSIQLYVQVIESVDQSETHPTIVQEP